MHSLKLRKYNSVLFYGLLMFILIDCSPTITTTRIDPLNATDLSGYWNDTDSRIVAEEMVNDLLQSNWINNYITSNDSKPRIVIGIIRIRDASEHIKTNSFINDIERELINSGKFTFIANVDNRKQLRDERIDQQIFATLETAKELGSELAADYMMQGNITMFIDYVDKIKMKYYKVDIELIDIESHEKVWLGKKEIKKIVSQKRVSW